MKIYRLTHERLKDVLRYSPDTGLFSWRKDGRQAGRRKVPEGGYIDITIDGEKCGAHRLAIFYMTGSWPISLVDHKDRDKTNNAYGNLRVATYSINAINSKDRCDRAASPYRGVQRNRGRWQAIMRRDTVRRSLGTYDTPEAARDAYAAAL